MTTETTPEILAMARRPLSNLEEQGWRQFWDGWAICPDCIAAILAKPEHAKKNGVWPVPADYSSPISDASKCSRCPATALRNGEHYHD